jgi:small ubiquitin-related modifier
MTEKDGDDTIHLKVKSQENDEVFFKIKRSTQLGKLMQKYCERQGVDFSDQISNMQNVRFLYDGERLLEKNTPNDLNMQSGDEIDVVVEQVGGERGQARQAGH